MRRGDATASSAKNWLVKSSTRILGPFDMAELTEHLRLKNISIIDEIREPSTRWKYIRENAHLLEVIRKLRDEEDPHSEKTMTQSLAQHTFTRTDTSHADDFTPAPLNTEITPTPPGGPPLLKDIAASEVSLPRSVSSATSIRSYGASYDPRVQAKVAQRSRFMQVLLILLTMAIAGGVFWNLSKRNQVSGAGYEELRAAAIRFKSLGLYQKSLLAYQQASQIKEPDTDFSIEMAPVLISEDRQTIQGRRILEKVLGLEGQSRSEIMEAYLGIAMSYMMEGDFQQAEQTLQKSLGSDPSNFAALMNLAIIQLKKSRWSEASKSFDELYRRNNRSSLALFGRGVAEIESARQTQQTSPLHKLERDIKSHLQKNWYLRQELMLLRTYSLKMLGDVDAINQAVVQFLSIVPGEAKMYSHPLFVDWRFSRWESLDKYCQQLYPEQSAHAGFKALRAVCLMENNRDADANKLLQESKAEAPKDPYVLQTEAAYLVKMSRYPEALAILKMPELMTLAGKNVLLVRYCYQQNDVNCVTTSANQLLQTDSRAIDGYFGIAWSAWRRKDRARAYDYVRTGLELEPLYLPLLELRDNLEAR